MYNQRAVFACTALLGTNKAGILKPDASGYYTLVLGALNIFNNGGAYYPYGESAQMLFKESSSFIRRINNGALRGEYGHPRMLPGMSMRDYMSRITDIMEDKVCCHIRKVWLDFTNTKDEKGRRVIAIMGEVKPTGPYGEALKASLDNPSENVCFSIRSLTNDERVGGVVNKHLKTIVTWDYVNEPGLSVAKKWHSPALESLSEEVAVMPAHLASLRNHQRRMNVGMESSHGVSAAELIEELGWNKTGVEMPGSARW